VLNVKYDVLICFLKVGNSILPPAMCEHLFQQLIALRVGVAGQGLKRFSLRYLLIYQEGDVLQLPPKTFLAAVVIFMLNPRA
jgi:hypothetical protein